MANLKDLRKRIQVVKSTKKITSAMKLVATSYMKKAEGRYHSGLSYRNGFQGVVDRLCRNLKAIDTEKENELIVGRKGDKCLLILLSADRGLCAGFNGNIGRYASKRIQVLQDAGKKVHVLCIGKKAAGALKPNHKQLVEKIISMPTDRHYHDVSILVEKVIKDFYEEKFDTCEVIYNQFKSILACLPRCEPFIPLQPSKESLQNKNQDLYDMEPIDDEFVNKITTKYLVAHLYAAVVDSQISEQSSRMMAMDSASRNAEDLIGKMELKYNRTRQSIITSELIEIISGAEAL